MRETDVAPQTADAIKLGFIKDFLEPRQARLDPGGERAKHAPPWWWGHRGRRDRAGRRRETATRPTNRGLSRPFRAAGDGVKLQVLGTSVLTAQQVIDAPPGFSSSLKLTVTTAQ